MIGQNPICMTVLYVIIVVLIISAGHLSDRIKYFVGKNEILLVFRDRPTLFMKTVMMRLIKLVKQNCCSVIHTDCVHVYIP